MAGVSAAVHLPLDEDAWDVVAREVLDLLDTVPHDSGLHADVVRVASLVPVDSVRAALADAAAGEGPAAALVRSILHRPSAEDAAALVAAAAAGDVAAAEHLARVPVEDFDVDLTPLQAVAERGDAEMRFWAGLTLARRDPTVFDAVLESLDDDEPAFMWGSPWVAYDRIVATRPLPAALISHLVGKLDALGDTRSPRLAIWAATGIADAEGTPAITGEPDQTPGAARAEEHAAAGETEPAQPEDVASLLDEIDLASHEWDPGRLARLSPDAAGDLVIGLLTRLADEAAAGTLEDPFPYAFGNGLVQVVAALPGSVDVPVTALAGLDIHALTAVIDDAQVAYALSAAGSTHVCRALEGRLSAAVDPGEKTRMFHLLEAVGGFETGERDAPLLGAGPGGGAETEFPVTAFDFSIPATGAEPMASGIAPPGEMSEGGPGAGVGEPAPAKRTAWPHLSCEDVVVAGAVFPVEVGLRGDRDPEVEGTGALSVPAGPFTLEVELMLDPDGFAVVGDRVFSLDVTPADPYPTKTVQLVAIAGQGLARDRRIGATFRVGGEIRGYAARNVAVVASAEEATSTKAPTQPVPASPSDVSEFPPGEAPDLSITISRGDDVARTKLLWSVSSHLVAFDVPEQTLTSDIGETPQAFLAQIVKKANETSSPLNLFSWLEGTGRSTIAPKIPPAVQSAIRKVIEAVDPRPPTILLVTEDPYVPWELAVLDPPSPDASASPFLGAQAVIGRWPLDERQKPPPRPPQQVAVADQAVVSGVYEGVPGWNRLKRAEEEAAELLKRWPRAKPVNASFEEVLACIRGDPPADVLHFALHGRFDLDGSRDGLILIAHPEGKPDENIPEYLQPGNVDSGELGERRPLVFLNACQVGASNLVLGDYSGMSHSFLFAGASAVVAALWSIDDAVASEVALGFYERSLGGDRLGPAEILRAERAKVTEDGIKRKDKEASVARLAYQFFGHPKMQLVERDQT